MRLLTSIIGAGVAAAAVAGGAFAVPALASPHAASHRMSFTAVTKASVGLSDALAGVRAAHHHYPEDLFYAEDFAPHTTTKSS